MSVLDHLQQRGQEAQLLEDISAKLSVLCQQQARLINQQQNATRVRAVEKLYMASPPQYPGTLDAGELPNLSGTASNNCGFDLLPGTNNTFEVQTIVVSSDKDCYVLLGATVLFFKFSGVGVEVLQGLRLPLKNGDRRILVQVASGSKGAYLGLFGMQEGDAYSIS